MDKLTRYRQCVLDFLTEEAQIKTYGGEIETETVFDLVNDRYLLIDLGWDGDKRIYNCVIHLEIKSGKIWIQRNQTDVVIAEELMHRGVAKDDIVLGLQHPSV